jgi:hypothetical protein
MQHFFSWVLLNFLVLAITSSADFPCINITTVNVLDAARRHTHSNNVEMVQGEVMLCVLSVSFVPLRFAVLFVTF